MTVDFAYTLSSSEFDCLNFHDGRSLSQQDRTNVAQCLRNILSLFLEDIGYQHHSRPTEQRLRQGLQDWSEEHLMHTFPGKRQGLQAIIDISAECAEYFYTLCGYETKLVMAILTTVIIATDDNSVLDPDERKSLSSFSFNHFQNLPEVNGWCTALTKGLKMGAEYFGSQNPLVGSLVANNYMAFIDACAQELRLEHELPVHLGNHGLSHPPSEACSVESFPTYFRNTTGVSLVYLVPIFKVSRNEEVPLRFWITVIPDLVRFITHINDLLSSPKEVMAGETWNYLAMKTQSKRQAGRPTNYKSKQNELWTFRDTLCETLEEAQKIALALDHAFTKCIRTDIQDFSAATDDITTSAENQKNQAHQHLRAAAQLWTSFKYGYISWHMNVRRYGLERIPIERYTFKPQERSPWKHKSLYGVMIALMVPLILAILKFGPTILELAPFYEVQRHYWG